MAQRLTDRETERRMLQTARSLVYEKGISTGLESIAFDDVIRRSGVSRTSAYRRWPSRDLFYGEVLLYLADSATLPTPEASVITDVAEVVRAHTQRLGTPRAHRDLVIELLRVSLEVDHEFIRTSPEWRTYRLLLASYEGIPNVSVRESVGASLMAADERSLKARARIYAEFTALLGYRLMSPLYGPDGYEFMSRAAGATMTGVLARATLGDHAIQRPRLMRAFDSSTAATWIPAVYMVAATVLSYIEPDPGITWSKDRIEDLSNAISRLSPAR